MKKLIMERKKEESFTERRRNEGEREKEKAVKEERWYRKAV